MIRKVSLLLQKLEHKHEMSHVEGIVGTEGEFGEFLEEGSESVGVHTEVGTVGLEGGHEERERHSALRGGGQFEHRLFEHSVQTPVEDEVHVVGHWFLTLPEEVELVHYQDLVELVREAEEEE